MDNECYLGNVALIGVNIMEKELQQQLGTILQKLTAVIEQGGNQVLEQLPVIVQQWLTYTLIVDYIHIGIFVVSLMLAYFVTFKWTNQTRDYSGMWQISKILSCVISGGVILITFINAVIAAFEIILIHTAPTVWIIKNIAYLIR